jgi:hypothetical protein
MNTESELLAECARLRESELFAEVERLRTAIRKHRDQRGDDRCWMDDEELYKALPEGYFPPERDTSVELEHCKRFIACRRNPATAYVSPERRIEELEHRIKEIEDQKPRHHGKDQ